MLSSHNFYPIIRCLACRANRQWVRRRYFPPQYGITRVQITKMASSVSGFQEPVSRQTYTNVPPTQNFYEWTERLSALDVMSSYPCGQRTSKPCDGLNRPYFRPGEVATRGQVSKIVSSAAGFIESVSGQFYTDIQSINPFYLEIMRPTRRGVMIGYSCGGVDEPCDGEKKPFIRWSSPVPKEQASKIAANAFFPKCQTPNSEQ